MMMSHPVIAPPAVPVALREVRKVYRRGESAVRALDGVSVGFARHSFTAVMGPSGSGKSTLLHCAAGLERPTSGSVWLAGQDLGRLPERKLTRLRRSRAGFVFQAFNLVPALTVRENVLLPLRPGPADRWWCRRGLPPHDRIRRRLDRGRRRPASVIEGADKAGRAWREAGRAGRPRLAALAYVSLGDDAETHARHYLRHYYSFHRRLRRAHRRWCPHLAAEGSRHGDRRARCPGSSTTATSRSSS
jgi:hypothetical protein